MPTTPCQLNCPDGKAYRPFQVEGIRYALALDKGMIGDEMGLGKTIQAIGAVSNDVTISRVLVVCPASLKLNWSYEFGEWLTRDMAITVIRAGAAHHEVRADQIVIINYDLVKKNKPWIDEVDWDLVILDESQYLKNPKAARTRAVLGHRGGRGSNNKSVPKIPTRKLLFLSGTPILNRPVDLWPFLKTCDPKGLGKSYWAYVRRYCQAFRGQWGWDVRGAAHKQELNRKLVAAGIILRRLKKDVLPELPPKTRQIIEIPSAGNLSLLNRESEQYQSYQQFTAEGHDSTKNMTKEEEREHKIVMGELAAARIAVAELKIPAIKELIETALENGPVVVFAHHHAIIEAICAGIGSYVTITGRTPLAQRHEAVTQFQNGDVDLIIGNIQAMGVGLTLTRSSHIIFAEMDWTPAVMTQAEDRCHRIGQVNPLLIQHVVLEDSLDMRIVKSLVKKQDNINEILDGAAPKRKKRRSK